MSDYPKEWPAKYFWAILLCCCLPALYFYNPVPLYFTNDDFIHIPLSQQAVWGQRNSIRPFGDFTLYLDALLYNRNAVGYHVTNLILHVACSVLVYFLALKVFAFLTAVKNQKFYAALSAALFFTYAFHAESVFWIIGRTGELGTLFFLICLLLFLSKSRTVIIYLLSFVGFVCGLLSYESVWILPPVLLLFAVLDSRFRSRRTLFLIAGYWLLFAAYLYLRIQWTGELTGSYEGENFKAFDVARLGLNYVSLVLRSFVGPQQSAKVFLVSAAVVVCIYAILLFVFFRKKRPGKWLLVWTGIALLSYLPYTSLGIDTHGVEGERYLYMPSVFVCILLVVAGSKLPKRWAIIVAAVWFLYNQYFLYRETMAFRIAGYVSETTMRQVNEHRLREFYYFAKLPHENYGVPIFRLGLAEGISWMTGDSTAGDRVRILSFNKYKEFIYSRKPFVEQTRIGNVSADSFYISTPKSIEDYKLIRREVQIRPEKDLLIEYTADSMYIRR